MDDDETSSDNDDETWYGSGFYSESKYEFVRQLCEEEKTMFQLLKTVRAAKNKVELDRLALISEFVAQSENPSVPEANVPETSDRFKPVPDKLSLQPNEHTQILKNDSIDTSIQSFCKNPLQNEDDSFSITSAFTGHNNSEIIKNQSSEEQLLQMPESAEFNSCCASVTTHSKSFHKQRTKGDLGRSYSGLTDTNNGSILSRMVDGNFYPELMGLDSSNSESEADCSFLENM